MIYLVERLCRVGEERQRTTAHDDPTHYLHVVAKISNADGLLMLEAADEITRLTARVAELEAALKPLACTCAAESQDECSRSEKHCPFWNARAALTQPAEKGGE